MRPRPPLTGLEDMRPLTRLDRCGSIADLGWRGRSGHRRPI